MRAYRIYTEDKNREAVKEIINHHFHGFTLYSGEGYWKGSVEPSLIIEVLDDDDKQDVIQAIARAIKEANDQEAVLVQTYNVNTALV